MMSAWLVMTLFAFIGLVKLTAHHDARHRRRVTDEHEVEPLNKIDDTPGYGGDVAVMEQEDAPILITRTSFVVILMSTGWVCALQVRRNRDACFESARRTRSSPRCKCTRACRTADSSTISPSPWATLPTPSPA